MSIFNKDMSVEEIVDGMQKVTETVSVETGKLFLQYKLQQQLLSEQKEQQKAILEQQNIYNKKQLCWSRWLTIGTWALVIATILLVIFK